MPAKSSTPIPVPRGMTSIPRPKLIRAWALRAAGGTWSAIAAELGESVHTVRRVLNSCPPPEGERSPPLPTHGYRTWRAAQNKRGVKPATEPRRPVAPVVPQRAHVNPPKSDPETEVPAMPEDLLAPDTMGREEQKAWYTKVMRESEAQANTLRKLGSTDEARKITMLGISASKELARLNRDDGGDTVNIDRKEIRERALRVRAKIEAYLDTQRPLLCADCGCKLSVKWGNGE